VTDAYEPGGSHPTASSVAERTDTGSHAGVPSDTATGNDAAAGGIAGGVDVGAGVAAGTSGGPGDPPWLGTAASDGAHRRHTARWIGGIVLVVLVAVIAVVATRPSYQATEADSPIVGHEAPPIIATTVTGQRFDLASYRGRWVVLNFFASWCVPCQEEEPNLVAFAFDHRQPGGPAMVGVVFEDTDGAARDFQQEEGATWPTVGQEGGKLAIAYGVTSPPETFLISPTGMVAAHIYGAVTESFLDQQLARAERDFG